MTATTKDRELLTEGTATRYPNVSVTYRETDPQNETYRTNDREGGTFPERYAIEENGEVELFETLGQAAARASKATGRRVAADAREIATALEDFEERRWNEGEPYYGCSFHEYEVE